MKNKKRRRRKRKARISLPAILLLFLLLLLIPLLCCWLSMKHIDETVPDHATGYIVETMADAE